MSEAEHPPTLDYHLPDAHGAQRIMGQAIGSAILTAAALVGLVAAVIYVAFLMSYGRPGNNAMALWMMIGAGVVVLATMTFLSVRLYRSPLRRGWAIGMWIGVGIACLIEGGCFMLLR